MRYVIRLEEVDRTQLALVGGKGAQLGELTRIEGTHVPAGFCVTTDAFREVVTSQPWFATLLERPSAEVRHVIQAVSLPAQVQLAIQDALAELTERVAVRSSATAEDMPGASFAGQHDSYLDVVGLPAVLQHVTRVWASLFTERAVAYRRANGLDPRAAQMAVVVQQMVRARSAGVVFTADPVTSHRKIAAVEASVGLGEALVSGRVNPDVYRVRDGVIVARSLGRSEGKALTEDEVIRLVELARTVEAHFGQPQDIEWCLHCSTWRRPAFGGSVDSSPLRSDVFRIVQSRPITTLFPIPTSGEGERIYISVGHQQMMTDAMKPLGISLWQLTTRRPMFEAGSRLFVDVTRDLASPTTRAALLGLLARSEPLMHDALASLLGHEDLAVAPAPRPPAAPLATDGTIVTELVARNDASVAALQRDIASKSGRALLDFLFEDLEELKRLLFDPRSHQVIMAGMEATWWLHDQLEAWLGEKGAADALTQSLPDNVTSQMGLALLDVADAIRPHPAVVAFLRTVGPDRPGFLDEMGALDGGPQAREAILGFLDVYGMRCVGEIDITRPRWSEQPAALVPVILGNILAFAPGARARRFEQGLARAEGTARELLSRLRALPEGEQKAAQTEEQIARVRTFAGYREYPKFGIVRRYFLYKEALRGEAARLVHAGVLDDPEDIFYLTLPELREVVASHARVDALVRTRREAFRTHRALSPPRVLTSDGECISGSYRRTTELPRGALAGLAVSAGIAEGRARVVHDIARAELQPGDILVTTFTDPSWTPLFVTIAGLVTEVGGLMTHGAVIARELGVPAVVGVEDATRLVRDGQRIRVHGTEGYVEVLPDERGGGS